MKHTPGPWHFEPAGVNTGKDFITATRLAHSDEFQQGEHQANMSLIAAAPELLAFAKHVLEQIQSGACGYIDGREAELRNYAEQLINKVEGK